MLHDLDDEQKAALALIGSFMKGIVHNINTPLSTIMGRSEMLQLRFQKVEKELIDTVGDAEYHKCLKDLRLILENSSKIYSIVKNVMQKSINTETQGAQPVNVAQVLNEEFEFMHADMNFKHNIEKSFTVNSKIPVINGRYVDFSNSFVEIMQNSINALKHAEVKKIAITVTSDQENIEVVFHDTGTGMQTEQVAALLSVLRGEPSDEETESSSKRGIQRVAQLLRPYNARFSIQSQPGDTTFVVRFPLKK